VTRLKGQDIQAEKFSSWTTYATQQPRRVMIIIWRYWSSIYDDGTQKNKDGNQHS
jgi:hypothetical protein